MKVRTVVILGVILLLAIVATIFLVRPFGKTPEAARGSAPVAKALAVNAIVTSQRPFDERVTLSGSIISNEAVEIRPEISGRVVKISFVEGQRVRKGQLLLKMFDADLQASLLKVQRQVQLDSDKVRRLKQIRTVDGVSVEELENALATYEMHKAEEDVIRAQIAKTAILAPFNGTIGLRNVSEGAVVTPSTLVSILKDDTKLKLECTVPERYASYISTQTTLDFVVRGSQHRKSHSARVYAADPELDARSRTLRIRANIDDASDLIPGMFADVSLNIGTVKDAILVPTESIVVDIKGAKLFVARNGVANEVRVETGTRGESDIRVIGGVQPGDTVLTTGMLVVKDGMPVSVSVSKSE